MSLRNALIALVFFLSGPAWADPGLDAVRALGRLNGEALACKQKVFVDRIRTAIVYEAAKTREIGEVFEQATSERFLAMGAEKIPCPDSRSLSQQIEAGIATMRAAFRVQRQ